MSNQSSLELPRAIFHFCLLMMVLGLAWIFPAWLAKPAAAICIILVIIFEKVKIKNQTFKQKIKQRYGCFFRQHEFERQDSMLYSAVANAVVFLIFPFYVFRLTIIIAAVCDPLARLIGSRYGQAKVFFNRRKTYLGTFAFWQSAFLICLAQTELKPAIIISFLAALTEALADRKLYFDDNWAVPLVTSLSAYLLI